MITRKSIDQLGVNLVDLLPTKERVIMTIELITQEKLEELEAKYVRIAHIIGKNQSWEVVFRKPTRQEYKMFRSNAGNDAKKADATEILCRSLVIYPTREQFDALLEDFPAICEASSPVLMDLCGLSVDQSGK